MFPAVVLQAFGSMMRNGDVDSVLGVGWENRTLDGGRDRGAFGFISRVCHVYWR